MKILSFLNISNIDNIECDSGFIFQKLLGTSIIEAGHQFTLIMPENSTTELPHIQFHSFGTDKFQVRYSFAWEEITSLIKNDLPDVIICNQPELASNFKAILTSENLPIRLITYIHYFPFSFKDERLETDSSLDNKNMGSSIIFSFLSGLLASDRILVHSRFAEDLTIKLCKYYHHDHAIPPISVLPPPFDERLLNVSVYRPKSEKTILYNHRLYKQYGTDFLIEFARAVAGCRDWRIIITDLLFNRSSKRVNLDKTVENYRNQLLTLPNVIFRQDGNNRLSYAEIIQNTDVAIAPYRDNCTWSMSVVDCMSLGKPVLAPDIAWFKEFIPDDLRFICKNTLIDKLDMLFEDNSYYAKTSENVRSAILNERMLDRKNISLKLLDLI